MQREKYIKIEYQQIKAYKIMKKNKVITSVIGEKIILTGNEVFVTMTDKFLSGWGCASNKISKRVIICNNRMDAEKIKDRLFNPKHLMKNVNIVYSLPYYNPNKYTTSYDVYKDSLFNF